MKLDRTIPYDFFREIYGYFYRMSYLLMILSMLGLLKKYFLFLDAEVEFISLFTPTQAQEFVFVFMFAVASDVLSIALAHVMAVVVFMVPIICLDCSINHRWRTQYYVLALIIANIKPAKLIPSFLISIDIIRFLVLKFPQIQQTLKRYTKSILPVSLERIITLTQYHSACIPV